jgi:ferredoxin, 2Fe-2S
MPKVTFITHAGQHHDVEVPVGQSLMAAAVSNGVPGIDGDCGGQCACATCHVFVDERWLALLPAASTMETEMLSFAAEVRDSSRLGCQIPMTEALDGLTVTMPEAQH